MVLLYNPKGYFTIYSIHAERFKETLPVRLIFFDTLFLQCQKPSNTYLKEMFHKLIWIVILFH